MEDIFSDLKGLGLDDVEDLQIYKEEINGESEVSTLNEKILSIESALYTSKLKCPVCDKEVHFRAVKTGKVRLVKTDLDLRPIYDILDPSMYEVVCCNHCGYAALRKQFLSILPKKANLIKKNVSGHFVGRTYPDIYSYDIAIERYKLALYDAMVMDSKDSEKAFLCLKIAWLYRGYLENEPLDDIDKNEQFKKNEDIFLGHALEGFKIAHFKESFPTMGLDLITTKYLIGELSRRLGHREDAMKWISEVVVSKSASRRLKERAIESKELLKQAKDAQQTT